MDDEQTPLLVKVKTEDVRQVALIGAELFHEAYIKRLDRLVSLSKPSRQDSIRRRTFMQMSIVGQAKPTEPLLSCHTAIIKLRELYHTAITKWFPFIVELYNNDSPGLMESLKAVASLFEKEADVICSAATPELDPPEQRIAVVVGDGEVGKTFLLLHALGH
jgi:hypothetical protein